VSKPSISSRLTGSLLLSLRYRNNRVFWIGTSISSIAQAAFLVSAGWLAFEQGGASAAGLITFAVMFPFLLSTPVGGLLADRLDRRSIVLATQVFQAALAILLGVMSLIGVLPVWLLFTLVLISSAARTVELPTVGAVIPNLVPREALLNNYSLNTLATLGSRFVGPVLLAPVLALGGAGAAFLVIAALYIPACAFVRRTPSMPRGALTATTLRAQVLEGGQFIRAHGLIAALLGLLVLHCWMTMSYDSTLPLFAESNLGGSGATYSSLVAGSGIGAIIGSLVLAGMRNRSHRGPALLASAIVSGLSIAAVGFSGVWIVAMLAMIAVGASQGMFMTLTTTLVQESVPDALRGRVTGLFLMSAGGVMSFANLGHGYLADQVGALPVLALPAGAYVLSVVLISALYPRLRRVYRDGSLPAATTTLAPSHAD
jgi:MFS family permease